MRDFFSDMDEFYDFKFSSGELDDIGDYENVDEVNETYFGDENEEDDEEDDF